MVGVNQESKSQAILHTVEVAPYCAHDSDSWVFYVHRWTTIYTRFDKVRLVGIEVFFVEGENTLALRLHLPVNPFLGGVAAF